MSPALLFLLFLAAIVIFVVAERARQRRKGSSKGSGAPLLRTGMLEPDRKVEMLVREDDATVQEETGAPPEGGPPKEPR